MQLQNLICTDIFTGFKHVSASKMEFMQAQDWEFMGDLKQHDLGILEQQLFSFQSV